jgi:hypothetical protein
VDREHSGLWEQSKKTILTPFGYPSKAMTSQSNRPTRANRLMAAALAAGGCVIGCAGCCVILYVYAFASMISSRLIGWDRWSIILQKMLLTPSAIVVFAGVIAIAVGVAVIAISLRTAFVLRAGHTRKIGSIVVLVAVMLSLIILLTISM